MKHLLLTLTLLTSFFACAQIVNIPDVNFKNALLNYNPPIDTNGDGEIQFSEAGVVINLGGIADRNISDLTGIEAFVNVELLNLFRNSLTVLDISQNINLSQLSCGDNNLTNLDVSQNINLLHLNFGFNNISSIDVSSNINLISLECYNNPITNLNLSNNINLEILSSDYCPFTSLDISNNTKLKSLVSRNNGLTALDTTNNPDLEIFVVYNNNILNLDVSQNPNLKQLLCYNNSLSFLDVTQNSNLEFLWFGGNEISEIDVSQNPMLDWIDYHLGPLTNIDMSANINLKDLRLSNTQLTEINLNTNVNLCRLTLKDNFSLEYINLKNGNEEVFGEDCPSVSLSVQNNPSLKFICVEDAQYAAANFTDIPPLATFVEDCSIANGDLNQITGTVTYDDENNGCDSGDAGVGGLLVNTTDGSNNFATTTINNGDYNLTVAENTYTTTVLGLSPYFTLSPAQAVDAFVGFNQTEVADFCIAPNTTANDLAVTLVPLIAARPGFEARYKLVYENVGTTSLSGDVELDFDGALVTFVEATPTETSINGNTISWDYSNLNPFEIRTIEVIFEVAQPPLVEEGDVLPYIARVNPVSGDDAPDDNVFSLNQIVVNSFDPNDKQVLEGYQVLIEDADEYLHYVVRFQNMGTAHAVNVRVQDALDEKLDWTTLKVLDESHAMETQLANGSIDFIFDDINLPTAASDPEGSKGFVAFKVKPLSTIQLDDVVANAADIYFDFNAAIVTNTVFTKFVDELGVDDFEALKVVAYPNPANDILNIQAEDSISSIEVINLLGQTLLTSKGKSNKEQLDISGLSAGNYFVRVFVGDESSVLRVVKF